MKKFRASPKLREPEFSGFEDYALKECDGVEDFVRENPEPFAVIFVRAQKDGTPGFIQSEGEVARGLLWLIEAGLVEVVDGNHD